MTTLFFSISPNRQENRNVDNSISPPPKTIVVDWGTTSLRVYLVETEGNVLKRRETQRGIQFIAKGAFEAELLQIVGDWLAEHGALPVIASGMVTSRNGWIEVPYVKCPADICDLARGVASRRLENGSPIIFIPGLTDTTGDPYPDVMRGEETQIAGFGLQKPATLVLPGTHSKWVQVANGQIRGFQTFVTGEMFDLLARQSFFTGASAGPHSMANWDVFDRGVRQTLGARQERTPLLNLLFSARTGMLAGKLDPAEIHDYISGLLIGSEFRAAQDCGKLASGAMLAIVGNHELNERYKRAAEAFGLRPETEAAEVVVRGSVEIARNTREFDDAVA